MIELRRAYLPDGSATFGLLTVGDQQFHTLELPWRGNAPFESCIPEGAYTLMVRPSAVVERTSRGEFVEGWEVTGVTDRDQIMFHVGNWVHNTEGCILIGKRFTWHRQHGPMVTNSQRTFRSFMKALSARDEWQIDIRCNYPEYP